MTHETTARWLALSVSAAMLCTGTAAMGHSVGQIQTAKRISKQTVVLLDPQGNPAPGGMGTDTKAKVGDILSFVIQFTPIPNNATRGGGGYITDYIPANTEVVGARIIDKNGNTIAPKRGGQYHDGFGPKDRHNELDALGLKQGSVSAHYADTGIFFSTDPATARTPNNAFITLFNGLLQNPQCTGGGGLLNLLSAGPGAYAHNSWDLLQMYAFGVKNGTVQLDGRGSTAYLYGSAVAGPETHYPYAKLATPACSDGADNDADGLKDYPVDPQCASTLDNDETNAADGPTGPWKRIRYSGSEIGTGGPMDCNNCASEFVRVGVPTDLGVELSGDKPLPAATNAIRFAVGELIVGEEYFAEISLRVKALPLDPLMNADVNCSEVFGGDAAMPQSGQDNTWRYYVPAPACVQLNLLFDLAVDKLVASTGDTLTYTLKGKNLSVNQHTNVIVTDAFVAGDVSFKQTLMGPNPIVAAGKLTWPTMTLTPGQDYTFVWEMNVLNGALSTVNRASYVSTQLPSPGFTVQAQTTIDSIAILAQQLAVMPTSTKAGSNVHYQAIISNSGTGATQVNGASFARFKLPAGFAFCGAAQGCTAPKINNVNVVNPTTAGQNRVTFTTGLVAAPAKGGTMTVDFDVAVGAAVNPGKYTVDMQTQLNDPGIGRDVEISGYGLAALLVDILQSDAPVIDVPVVAGATSVTGVSNEGLGAEVTLFVNGNPLPKVVAAAAGVFKVTVPTLYAGQHINATAKAAAELESKPSAPDVVVQALGGVTACNDGLDNDDDKLVDFPADKGCSDLFDQDEEEPKQCADGKDNDNDGKTDYPNDASCSSLLDDDESGLPACSNTIDDDGDGKIDFPADKGCADAGDASESDIAACANGIDDDGDGKTDYPIDPGCESAFDDDEQNDAASGTGGAGGAIVGAGGTADAVAGAGGLGNGLPPDRGGVTGDGAGDDGGCGCRLASTRGTEQRQLIGLIVLAAALLRRRRTRTTKTG